MQRFTMQAPCKYHAEVYHASTMQVPCRGLPCKYHAEVCHASTMQVPCRGLPCKYHAEVYHASTMQRFTMQVPCKYHAEVHHASTMQVAPGGSLRLLTWLRTASPPGHPARSPDDTARGKARHARVSSYGSRTAHLEPHDHVHQTVLLIQLLRELPP